MRLAMFVEISDMTIGTTATITAINRGIAMAVDANDQIAIDTGVTVETIVLVDNADGIVNVAIDAKRGVGDR